jgi:hypothetical protein
MMRMRQSARLRVASGEVKRPLCLAAILWLGLLLGAQPASGDVLCTADDSGTVSAADLGGMASEAGTTAGFAAVCNIDPAPIHAAFHSLFHSALTDHGQARRCQ